MSFPFTVYVHYYVVLCKNDAAAAQFIVNVEVDHDKDEIEVLSPHLLMAYSGEPGMLLVILKLSLHLTDSLV